MAKKAEISPELTELYRKVLERASALPLTDQLKILDRGIKIEQIKHRMKDDGGFGTDFDQLGGEDDDT
jgi:hypothetical protein